MSIARATLADLDAVLPLLAAQLAEHGMPQETEVLRAAVAGLLEDPARGAMFVARDVERTVGVASLSFTWTLEHGGRVVWLEELYVMPSARAHGVGTALLGAALAWAREAGCRAVDLEVDIDHARVESLYRRHAFEPLPRRRFSLRF